MGQRILRFLARLLLPIMARVEIYGFDNIPASLMKAGFIFAPNHLGRLDTALLYYALDRDDLIMAVAEKYQNYFITRLLVRMMNGFFINRYEADARAVREILRRLQKGDYLAMAPEGTRSKTGGLQEGRLGVAFFASRAGVPVIPVGVTGTEDRVIIDNLRHFRRGHITVTVGKPFILAPVRGPNREEKLKEYTEDIMCRIAALLPESYRGVYADHPLLKQYLAEQHA